MYPSKYLYHMHFVWFSRCDGFFSPQVYKSHLTADDGVIWRRVARYTNHTIQNAFSHILYTSMHVNHDKYITVGKRQKPYEMDVSHNCSQHGRESDACEKLLNWVKSAITVWT